MNFISQPLWLVGFRPFFALACLAGASLPLAWVLIFSGGVSPTPTFGVTALQWHAHEMFFGFGWAVLGGFLLTSTKNWVGIRGHTGRKVVVDALGKAALWLMLAGSAFRIPHHRATTAADRLPCLDDGGGGLLADVLRAARLALHPVAADAACRWQGALTLRRQL